MYYAYTHADTHSRGAASETIIVLASAMLSVRMFILITCAFQVISLQEMTGRATRLPLDYRFKRLNSRRFPYFTFALQGSPGAKWMQQRPRYWITPSLFRFIIFDALFLRVSQIPHHLSLTNLCPQPSRSPYVIANVISWRAFQTRTLLHSHHTSSITDVWTERI